MNYRKFAAGIAGMILFGTVGVAAAHVGDTEAQMEKSYGQLRYIEDQSGNIWSKADWNSWAIKKQKPKWFVYDTTVNGTSYKIKAVYKNGRVQREVHDLNFSIVIKDFRGYYPDLYQQLKAAPKAVAVGQFRRNLAGGNSDPLKLGVIVKGNDGAQQLVTFTVTNTTQEIKELDQISPATIIESFEITAIDPVEIEYRYDLAYKTFSDGSVGEGFIDIDNPFV